MKQMLTFCPFWAAITILINSIIVGILLYTLFQPSTIANLIGLELSIESNLVSPNSATATPFPNPLAD